MSIPRDLLLMTEGIAPGIGVYGGTGLKKTHAIHTFVPPILLLDVGEGGTASLIPWIARKRLYNERSWTPYSDDIRQRAYEMLREDIRKGVTLKPSPWIDVISFPAMAAKAWDELTVTIGNFDYNYYNTIALDSLHELSISAQSFTKGQGNEYGELNLRQWGPVQERTAIKLRALKEFRQRGIIVYTTASEDIQKDYVKDPRETKQGEAPAEPYDVRGSVNLPGKLVNAFPHMPDIVCHVRLLNGNVAWVTQPEPLPGGQAWWDGKDRYGRLDKYVQPNFRLIADALWGEATRKEIYGRAKEQVQSAA